MGHLRHAALEMTCLSTATKIKHSLNLPNWSPEIAWLGEKAALWLRPVPRAWHFRSPRVARHFAPCLLWRRSAALVLFERQKGAGQQKCVLRKRRRRQQKEKTSEIEKDSKENGCEREKTSDRENKRKRRERERRRRGSEREETQKETQREKKELGTKRQQEN